MKRPSRGTLFLWVAAGILLLTGVTLAGGAETAAIQSASTQISAIGRDLDTPLADRARSLLGLVVLGFIAWLLSNDRKSVLWRVVAWGTALQLLFAVFILRAPVGGIVFGGLNTVVMALIGFTLDGASFIFGNLVWDSVPVGTGPIGPGAQGVFQPSAGQQVANTGALIAFNVFPTIIFFSSLMTVLYHLRIMQVAVKGFA
jgi:CNT family concentrative nucleoside transporter